MKDKLVSDYCKAAQIQMDATYSGDSGKGNRASSKLYRYNDLIRADFLNYKSVVEELIHSENPNVIIWIACVALDEKYETDFVITRLKSIAQDKSLGIIGFNAKMVLETSLASVGGGKDG